MPPSLHYMPGSGSKHLKHYLTKLYITIYYYIGPGHLNIWNTTWPSCRSCDGGVRVCSGAWQSTQGPCRGGISILALVRVSYNPPGMPLIPTLCWLCWALWFSYSTLFTGKWKPQKIIQMLNLNWKLFSLPASSTTLGTGEGALTKTPRLWWWR